MKSIPYIYKYTCLHIHATIDDDNDSDDYNEIYVKYILGNIQLESCWKKLKQDEDGIFLKRGLLSIKGNKYTDILGGNKV